MAQVMPSILKVAVSGFTAAMASFVVDEVSAEASVFGSLAVSLQLVNKILVKTNAKNDLVKFIILNLNLIKKTMHN